MRVQPPYVDEHNLRDAPGGGTLLRATTYAEFPGLRGRGYRALVIGSRLHVVATRGMLRSVARASQAASAR